MRRLGALVLGVVALGLAPASAHAEGASSIPFVGEWMHVGGETEEQRVRDAIEACVSEMGFLVRPLARRRLLDGSRISHADRDRGRHVVGRNRRGRRGAARRAAGTRGEAQVAHWRHDGLVQWRTSEDGSSRVTYRLVDGGRRLVTDVQTTSQHLPRPVSYRLTYERR